MQLFGIVLRTLLGVPLFLYLPGYLIERTLLGDASPLRGVERHVNRIVASVLLVGWTAFLLAEAGWFSYWLLAGIAIIFCTALRLWPRAQASPLRGPGSPLGIVAHRPPPLTTTHSLRSTVASLRFDHLLLGTAICFGLLVARPFEVIRGGLDAGVYANTGVAITRTGGIVQHDAIVQDIGRRAAAGELQAQQFASNVFGVQSKQRWLATRIRAAGFFITEGELAEGRVVPQFFHLWPAWIAIFVSMLGPTAGLVATGAAGTLGVVLLGLLGRRLGGATTGFLAAAFLALMTPQVWFSRMSTSEAMTQALLLAGVWSFSHFGDAQDRRQRIWWGGLAGMAFGEVALTRIDFPLALGPVLLLLLYTALTRRWHAGHSALGFTLGVLLVHTALHIVFIARAYFFDTYYAVLQHLAITIYLSLPFLTPELQERFMYRWGSNYQDPWRIWIELAGLGLAFLVLLAAWRRPGPLLQLESALHRHRRWLLGTFVAALTALAAYAYVIRPGILTVDAILHPLAPTNWLRLQGYIGAPIAVPSGYEKETIGLGLANMARMGWYLSPLGVALGTIGSLLLWWRLDRRSWLFLTLATVFAFFYIRSLYGTSEQTYIYILRRYVPLVYPAFALAMAYALANLHGGSFITGRKPLWFTGRRWALVRSSLFVLLTGSLLLFFVLTGRTVYAHTEYAGALAQVEALSERLGDEDVVLVRGGGANEVAVRDTADLVVTPLTYMYGRHALPVKGRIPAKYTSAFTDQVTRWRGEGRQVFLLLAASGGDLLVPGYDTQSIDVPIIHLVEFQQLRNQKPKLSYVNELPFHLYELVPAGTVAPPSQLTSDDTAAQAAGFYRSEKPAGEARAAWTNGSGVLRLPAEAQGQPVTLRAGGGERPAALGAARLCVDAAAEPVPYPADDTLATLRWREIGCARLEESLSDMRLELPLLQREASVLLRLRSEPWIPSEVQPEPGTAASQDRRPLGVRFVGVTIGAE